MHALNRNALFSFAAQEVIVMDLVVGQFCGPATLDSSLFGPMARGNQVRFVCFKPFVEKTIEEI